MITLNLQPISKTVSTMYVCLCKGITDSQIRAAIQDGANSFREVRNTLGVASQCGKCGILTREILRETLPNEAQEQSLFYALS
ncbi:Bacterioferritin-associated ferredoxin [Halioglobus japonicus]|nr:Bacterioferritin-associated ferredoxin [Halioglobus japonicus]